MELIGRKKEFAFLQKNVEKLDSTKHFAGIISLSGKEGVGKSFLIRKFLQSLNSDVFEFIRLDCKSNIKQSFYPIITFLKLFFQIDVNNKNESQQNFEKKFDSIINASQNIRLSSGLNHSMAFIGELLNLQMTHSKYEMLDAALKYENTLFAIKTLFKALSLNKPYIIIVENSDWIDADTQSFFTEFVRNIDPYPILILFIGRKDQAKMIFPIADDEVSVLNIHLTSFDKSETQELLETAFDRGISFSSQIFKTVWDKTLGNPFFIQQLVEYLKKNKFLDADLNFLKNDENIPENLDLIISDKIENLDTQLKAVTKNASVLGNKFTVRVLSSMMQESDIKTQLEKGEKDNLWFSLSDIETSFRNIPLQEKIYSSIFDKELIQLHKLAAESLEQIYRDDLREFYPEIADNYKKAGMIDKAVCYFEKAGNKAKEMYHLLTALDYFEELLTLLQNNDNVKTFYRASLNKIEILLMINDTKQAKEEIEEIEIDKIPEAELSDKYYYLIARSLILLENHREMKDFYDQKYEFLQTSFYKNHFDIFYLDSLRFLNEHKEFEKYSYAILDKFQKNNEKKFETQLLNNIGIYYISRTNYQKAMETFQSNLTNVKQLNDKQMHQITLHHIGVVSSRLGNRQEAMTCYQQAYEIAKEIGNKNACSKIVSNIATLYAIEGKSKQALQFYNEGLELARNIGNRVQEEIVLYNIGEAYFRLKQYDTAIRFLIESKNICRKLSDLVGITYANELYGDILFSQNKIDQAENIYLENLEFQKQIDDKEGIAHAFGNLGNVYKHKKKYDQAEKYYIEQQKMLALVGDKEGEGKAYFNWAILEKARDNKDEAKIKLQQALKLFESCSYNDGIQMTKEQIAKL